jgi:hypothetical protein
MLNAWRQRCEITLAREQYIRMSADGSSADRDHEGLAAITRPDDYPSGDWELIFDDDPGDYICHAGLAYTRTRGISTINAAAQRPGLIAESYTRDHTPTTLWCLDLTPVSAALSSGFESTQQGIFVALLETRASTPRLVCVGRDGRVDQSLDLALPPN